MRVKLSTETLESTELEIAMIFILVKVIIIVISVLSNQEQVHDVGLLLLGDWVVHGAGPSHDRPLHHRGAPVYCPHQPQGVHLQGQQGLCHHCSCNFFLLPCCDDGFLLCQVSLKLSTRMLCFYESNVNHFCHVISLQKKFRIKTQDTRRKHCQI